METGPLFRPNTAEKCVNMLKNIPEKLAPWFTAALVVLVLLCACSQQAESAPTPTVLTSTMIVSAGESAALEILGTYEVPEEARYATRSGDPRPPAYWALWNTCAEENRADMAEANGGREAGWFLMDDLLADPGIQLGDLPVTTCEQGLALLQPAGAAGDPVQALAAQLLAAELNLNLGAESCPIAEEAVIGAHIILSGVWFDGSSVEVDAISAEQVEAISQLVGFLTEYNTGNLCINP